MYVCTYYSYIHTYAVASYATYIVKMYFCILTTAAESDDELSTGAVVAISIVVTFIITLVVTALITYIITSLYYKYRYELKEKLKVDDDKNVNTKQDPYGGNITMDTNPAYGTTTTIKMDTNPAYATTT